MKLLVILTLALIFSAITGMCICILLTTFGLTVDQCKWGGISTSALIINVIMILDYLTDKFVKEKKK
ncbi:MAG: hypothetical protein Q7T50_05055 [Candidatus Magasanikbacteria bacterium]|nr:hypothetical protein [Candidatus Magasanikbacteria bacterium]